MNWYLPITILPGLGLIIASTVSQMMALSNEISTLFDKETNSFLHKIADRKIKQLGLLTRASAMMYLAAGIYVLSGIIGLVFESEKEHKLGFANILLYSGTILLFIALSFLIVYALRAVRIRKDQFDHKHDHIH